MKNLIDELRDLDIDNYREIPKLKPLVEKHINTMDVNTHLKVAKILDCEIKIAIEAYCDIFTGPQRTRQKRVDYAHRSYKNAVIQLLREVPAASLCCKKLPT